MANKIEVDPWNKLAVIPEEAGYLLDISAKDIKVYMKMGELSFTKVGEDYKIWKSDLIALKEKLDDKQIDFDQMKLILKREEVNNLVTLQVQKKIISLLNQAKEQLLQLPKNNHLDEIFEMITDVENEFLKGI